MKKLFLLFGIVLLLVGCSSSPTVKNTVSTQEPSAPIVISMSGSLDQNDISEPFTITKSPFAVTWEFHPEDAIRKGCIFTVTAINKETGKKHEVAHIINIAFGNRVEISDTGTFYLSISAYGGSWSIQVQGE